MERQGCLCCLACLISRCQTALTVFIRLCFACSALSWGSVVPWGRGQDMRLFRKRWSSGLDWRPGLAAASVRPSGGALGGILRWICLAPCNGGRDGGRVGWLAGRGGTLGVDAKRQAERGDARATKLDVVMEMRSDLMGDQHLALRSQAGGWAGLDWNRPPHHHHHRPLGGKSNTAKTVQAVRADHGLVWDACSPDVHARG